MYAIIETGGKQHLIKEGDIVKVEKIDKKKKLVFDKILFLDTKKEKKIGKPYLDKVEIIGEKIKDIKDKKVISYKKKPKKRYHRKKGHRQIYSLVKIKKIKMEDKNGS